MASLAVLASLAPLAIAGGQGLPSAPPKVDLTSPPPPKQQGLGVPGGSGGTLQPPNYDLPVNFEIAAASVGRDGSILLEVEVRNAGPESFDFPISRDISDIQRQPSRLRREFFFAIRPSTKLTGKGNVVAVTAGSANAAHSFLKISPHGFARFLLRAETNLLRNTLAPGAMSGEVQVTGGEWTFDEGRFFVTKESRQVVSTNRVMIDLRSEIPRVTLVR